MVILPPGFVATKFPGYFWDTSGHKLYSMKVDGNLYELKLYYPSRFNHLRGRAYRVCHKGIRRVLMLDDLKKLTPADSVVGFSEKNK